MKFVFRTIVFCIFLSNCNFDAESELLIGSKEASLDSYTSGLIWNKKSVSNEAGEEILPQDSIDTNRYKLNRKGRYEVTFESIFQDEFKTEFNVNRRNQTIHIEYPLSYYEKIDSAELVSNLNSEEEFSVYIRRSGCFGGIPNLYHIKKQQEKFLLTHISSLNWKEYETIKEKPISRESVIQLRNYCTQINTEVKRRPNWNSITYIIQFKNKIYCLNENESEWLGSNAFQNHTQYLLK